MAGPADSGSDDAVPAAVVHVPDVHVPAASHTTSAEDQENVARLKARLEETTATSSTSAAATASKTTDGNDDEDDDNAKWRQIPTVEIAPGAHKYVQMTAQTPTSPPQTRTFVISKRGAHYHANVAEPFSYRLEEAGYSDIRVKGGGRINYVPNERRISIFGYSYGFGLADHALSKKIVQEDGRFADCAIVWSNDGY